MDIPTYKVKVTDGDTVREDEMCEVILALTFPQVVGLLDRDTQCSRIIAEYDDDVRFEITRIDPEGCSGDCLDHLAEDLSKMIGPVPDQVACPKPTPIIVKENKDN